MNSQYAQKAGCHGKFSPQAGIANYRRVAPTRQPNATYRTREYLTDAEIARLQAAAEAGNRDGRTIRGLRSVIYPAFGVGPAL